MSFFADLARMLWGAPQTYSEHLRDPNARQSTNVQDVTAFPPKPNPRSRGMLGFGLPHYYDPDQGKYADPAPDFITALLRAGLQRQEQAQVQAQGGMGNLDELLASIQPRWPQ